MPTCAKCYAEFPENDCVFCPHSGYLCSSCSNQEHVVICLDCGEHFPFYSMKEIDGRALCEDDYNKEMSEKEPSVREAKIYIHNVEEHDVDAKLALHLLEEQEGIESIEEIEYVRKHTVYEENMTHYESGVTLVLDGASHEEKLKGERKNSHLMSEEIIKDTHHSHHKCHGHHPISFY